MIALPIVEVEITSKNKTKQSSFNIFLAALGLDQAMIGDRPPFVVSLNSKSIDIVTKIHDVGGIEAIKTRSFGRIEAIK